MAVWNIFLLAVFLHCILSDTAVTALECFECSSVTDEGCGETFTIKHPASNAYLFPCVGMHALCRKMVHRDSHKGATIVTRSCWSSLSETHLPKPKCRDQMSVGTVCYCDRNSCNGQGTSRPSSILLVISTCATALLLAVLGHFV